MEETGCGIEDVNNRLVDYGIPEIWESHHPLTVPEPFTLSHVKITAKMILIILLP